MLTSSNKTNKLTKNGFNFWKKKDINSLINLYSKDKIDINKYSKDDIIKMYEKIKNFDSNIKNLINNSLNEKNINFFWLNLPLNEQNIEHLAIGDNLFQTNNEKFVYALTHGPRIIKNPIHFKTNIVIPNTNKIIKPSDDISYETLYKTKNSFFLPTIAQKSLLVEPFINEKKIIFFSDNVLKIKEFDFEDFLTYKSYKQNLIFDIYKDLTAKTIRSSFLENKIKKNIWMEKSIVKQWVEKKNIIKSNVDYKNLPIYKENIIKEYDLEEQFYQNKLDKNIDFIMLVRAIETINTIPGIWIEFNEILETP